MKSALGYASSQELEAALLDLQLGEDTIMPVARELARRGVPFVFYTGQVDTGAIIAEWPKSKIVPKPAPARVIVEALVDALSRAPIEQRTIA